VWLIVGLGNPGPKYQNNRHNVGFMVVDELARRGSVQGFRQKFGADAASCIVAGHNALLLKPMEFMNLSGYAVQRAAAFHRVLPSETIVVHDEIDLDFGRLRLKSGGGHGGHNGLRSIVEQLGSSDFLRVRVGVGKPQKVVGVTGAASGAGGSDRKVASWVLSDFPSADQAELDSLIDRAADSVGAIVQDGIRAAMNQFNADPKNTNETKKKDKSSTSGNPQRGEPS